MSKNDLFCTKAGSFMVMGGNGSLWIVPRCIDQDLTTIDFSDILPNTTVMAITVPIPRWGLEMWQPLRKVFRDRFYIVWQGKSRFKISVSLYNTTYDYMDVLTSKGLQQIDPVG